MRSFLLNIFLVLLIFFCSQTYGQRSRYCTPGFDGEECHLEHTACDHTNKLVVIYETDCKILADTVKQRAFYLGVLPGNKCLVEVHFSNVRNYTTGGPQALITRLVCFLYSNPKTYQNYEEAMNTHFANLNTAAYQIAWYFIRGLTQYVSTIGWQPAFVSNATGRFNLPSRANCKADDISIAVTVNENPETWENRLSNHAELSNDCQDSIFGGSNYTYNSYSLSYSRGTKWNDNTMTSKCVGEKCKLLQKPLHVILRSGNYQISDRQVRNPEFKEINDEKAIEMRSKSISTTFGSDWKTNDKPYLANWN